MLIRFVLVTFALNVLIAWLVLAFVLLHLANRRIERFETVRPGSAGMWCGLTPMLYAYSLVLWPLSFAVGGYLLRTPPLARQGRLSLVWVLAVVTVWLLAFFTWTLTAPLG